MTEERLASIEAAFQAHAYGRHYQHGMELVAEVRRLSAELSGKTVTAWRQDDPVAERDCRRRGRRPRGSVMSERGQFLRDKYIELIGVHYVQSDLLPAYEDLAPSFQESWDKVAEAFAEYLQRFKAAAT